MLGILRPDVDLELDEGERIIHFTRRHWLVLLFRIAVPLAITLLVIALATYRAFGGVFFDPSAGPSQQLVNPVNIILLIAIGALLIVWVRRSGGKKKRNEALVNVLLILGLVILGLILYFRYQGGRVFYVDPSQQRGGDVFNLSLLALGLLMLGVTIYIVIDWANDFLILTNTRVIVDDVQLLVRRSQQEIPIDNIQQVNLSADSYVAHFLGYLTLWRRRFMYRLGLRSEPPPENPEVAYGKLVVGSLSFRKLIFDWARDPRTMQQKITGELSKLRQQQAPEILRELIEAQVYDNKPPKPPEAPIHVVEHEGPIRWLFERNPEIEFEKWQITWRPYWLFLLLDMLPALGVFLLTTVLLIFAIRMQFLSIGIAFWIWLPITLVCLGRIIWVREEHANDKYILQRDKIIDVDKKPFGPESTRSAPLGSVQDVQYETTFWENILGYGDVTITTGGGAGNFTFKHVPDPRNVQSTINDYLTDFRKREKERSQKDALELLKQYHFLQLKHDELFNDENFNTISERVQTQVVTDVPFQVEREVAERVPDEVRRQMDNAFRRERRRRTMFRRRRA